MFSQPNYSPYDMSEPRTGPRATLRAMLRSLIFAVAISVVLVAAAACGGDTDTGTIPSVDTSDTRTMSLMQVAQRADGASGFMNALQSTNMVEPLTNLGPFTLFLPAQAPVLIPAVPQDTVQRPQAQNAGAAPATSRQSRLKRLIEMHIVRGHIASIPDADSFDVSTLAQTPITLRSKDGTDRVEGIEILRTIQARNGVVHVISRPLSLPSPDTTRAQQNGT